MCLGLFRVKLHVCVLRKEKVFVGPLFIENRVQRIADVHSFAGHITCDSLSRSERVLPL
uniref:Uncharacterized protein n=1 Tax=Arsenophonus nasoniae TaxID=638 RepID=D2TVU1_9GAMM|nr:conserved hypothetical protein [Arsenophonus nasoniae]